VSEKAARPFVKWAGGKRKLLPQLLRHVPEKFGTYHEPFVGGGALFFALQPKDAYLSDYNERLVRAYRGVRDDVEGVICRLRNYPHDAAFYYELRQQDVDSMSDAAVAAWFVYLNKIGFNGLYRVNRKNRFNVPFGSQKNPTICDQDNLRACSDCLRHAEVEKEDFVAVLNRARAGDFVYFDPPYVPLSVTESFVSYTDAGFGMQDHCRLRDVALELKRRSVTVLLSNSATETVRELYRKHFTLEEVLADRSINSNASKRGPVKELVIT